MTISVFTRTAAALLLGSALALPLTATAATTSQATAPSATSLHHKKVVAPASAQVKAAQTALNKQGANLTVDGHMGPKTRDALKSFQTAHGLKATGKLDHSAQAALKAL